jgi:hypothetical protein
MYLSPRAVEESVALVHKVSGAGSILLFDHMPAAEEAAPAEDEPVSAGSTSAGRKALSAWLARARQLASPHFWLMLWLRAAAHEPFRFHGWRADGDELRAWLAARGWRLLSDRSDADVAVELRVVPPATVDALRRGCFVPVSERFAAAAKLEEADDT